MLPAIVVINEKYRPGHSNQAPQVGASSFFSSVLKVFSECNKLAGIVYYRRNEDIRSTVFNVTLDGSTPSVTVLFNFQMPDHLIRIALHDAFLQLQDIEGSASPAVVYYQTDTLLQYHPRGTPFCVTHHGPFVADVIRCFSQDGANDAFGNPGKARILLRQQQRGIQRLREDTSGTVLVHSRLQQRFLQQSGIESTRFLHLTPPIEPGDGCQASLPPPVKLFVDRADLLLFTAAARLDYFKNVTLVVEAGLELIKRGAPIAVLIAGDPAEVSRTREHLQRLVPRQHSSSFLIFPKLAKDALYYLLGASTTKGIFVCPSRYETLGITPLEAAKQGVTTLISNSENVEAASYFPTEYRFSASGRAIADLVLEIQQKGIKQCANKIRAHVANQTSPTEFRDNLLSGWARMSNAWWQQMQSVRPVRNTKIGWRSPSTTAAVSDVVPKLASHVEFGLRTCTVVKVEHHDRRGCF